MVVIYRGERVKVKAAGKREQRKSYFYSAEREQVQAHGVRLKVKTENLAGGCSKANTFLGVLLVLCVVCFFFTVQR